MTSFILLTGLENINYHQFETLVPNASTPLQLNGMR
jgi:hypothetical protein